MPCYRSSGNDAWRRLRAQRRVARRSGGGSRNRRAMHLLSCWHDSGASSRRCCRCSRRTMTTRSCNTSRPSYWPLFVEIVSTSTGKQSSETPARLQQVRRRTASGGTTGWPNWNGQPDDTPDDQSRPRRRGSPETARAGRHRAAAVSRRRVSRSRPDEPLDGPRALPLVRRVVDRA